ncbi:MAG: DUF6575 domain-containing protein [Bacteroidota bacterium]
MSKNNPDDLPPIKGTQLPRLHFDFTKLGDFLFYEAPLLSHLVNQHDEDFLMQWCGNDATYQRWLLYKTSYHLLYQYFKGNLTDLDLLRNNPDGFAYIVDIDRNGEWQRVFVVAVEDIPMEYLPNGEITYDPGDFQPYTEELHCYLELHFSRQRKLYKKPESTVALAAEPPSPEYRKH